MSKAKMLISRLWLNAVSGPSLRSCTTHANVAATTSAVSSAAAARLGFNSSRSTGRDERKTSFEKKKSIQPQTPCYHATARGVCRGTLAVALPAGGNAATTRHASCAGSSSNTWAARRFLSGDGRNGGGSGKAGGGGIGGPGDAGAAAGSTGDIEIAGLDELEDVMQFGYTEETKHYSPEFQEYIRGGMTVPFDGESPTEDLMDKMAAELEKNYEIVDIDPDDLDLDELDALGLEIDPNVDGLGLQLKAAAAAAAEEHGDDDFDLNDFDFDSLDGTDFGADIDDDDDDGGDNDEDEDELHPEPWDLEGDALALDNHDMFIRKEVPRIECFEDMIALDEVDVHLSDTEKPRAPKEDDLLPHEAVQMILEEQGEEIVVLEVDEEHRHYANYVVLTTGRSRRHLRAMGDTVVQELRRRGKKTWGGFNRLEGRHDEYWMVVHCGDLVVHFFRPEAREYYRLEALWAPEGSPLYDPLDPGNL